MEHLMTFRIFDHLLANRRWTPTCQLDARVVGTAALAPAEVQAELPDRFGEATLPEETTDEAQSFLARLAYRSKLDPVMCRAGRRLQADPALSMRRLASELGVSERYLSSGLQAVLGASPKRFARIARIERVRAAMGEISLSKHRLPATVD
jgi:AraC-like DNA-binding protein